MTGLPKAAANAPSRSSLPAPKDCQNPPIADQRETSLGSADTQAVGKGVVVEQIQQVAPYYSDDLVTLYHGDCREATAWLDADVLVTDPPYGVAYKSGWDNRFRDVTIAHDETTLAREQALALWGSRPALVFGSWKIPRPIGTKLVLTWDKGTVGMGDLALPWFPCTEEIYVLGTGWVGSRTSAVLRHVGRNQHHPTEKPTRLLHSLIAKCPPGLIADPFAGSGSTLVAARNAGRRAIGVEIEERYCEIVAQRLAQGALDFGEVS